VSDDRAYPSRPIVGVGAVIVHGDGVVLVKRGTAPLRGTWSLPGGVMEVGEPLADAVAREVREETGLEVAVGPLVDAVERIYRDEAGRVAYHYVLLDYLCRVTGGELAAGSDASEVKVVEPQGLAAQGLSPATIGVIDKALVRHASR
jgi:8-oxo-dGTP diphosphatase